MPACKIFIVLLNNEDFFHYSNFNIFDVVMQLFCDVEYSAEIYETIWKLVKNVLAKSLKSGSLLEV